MRLLQQRPPGMYHLQIIKEHVVITLVTAIYKNIPVFRNRDIGNGHVTMIFHRSIAADPVEPATGIIKSLIKKYPADIGPGFGNVAVVVMGKKGI